MELDHSFAVFAEGEEGPQWRLFACDLETAKRKAQQLATEEGMEFFVFSIGDASEVARLFPKREVPCA